MREFITPGAAMLRDEVLRQKTPAVLRGLASEWPAVRAARDSPQALLGYLSRFATETPVDALMTAPEIEGEIFYDENLRGFNFHRNRLPIMQIAAQILRYAQFERAPAVAAQSALIESCLPGFAAENGLEVLAAGIRPRIWLGNRITTPIHVDEWNNIGCVVAGRRRFTLFPPEQIDNLYIGPLDFAPTGAPMSLVSLRRPDLARYPRFQIALNAAQTVELAGGDALFIPPLWWHHVESLEPFNVLVNYWWHEELGDGTAADSAFEALVHGILAIRSLPGETRGAWRAFFEQYVFQDAPLEHIPADRLGLLGKLSAPQRAALRKHLKQRLRD
ncbi:MAG TPA: cupin-like domain-containing protein [Steroidobacteraceae bacterium]